MTRWSSALRQRVAVQSLIEAWPNATPLRNGCWVGVTATVTAWTFPVQVTVVKPVPLAMLLPTASVTVTLRPADVPRGQVTLLPEKMTAPLAAMVALPSLTEMTGGDEDWTLTDAPAGSENAATEAAAIPSPARAGRRKLRFMVQSPRAGGAGRGPVHLGWGVLHRAPAGRVPVRPGQPADRRAAAGPRGARGSRIRCARQAPCTRRERRPRGRWRAGQRQRAGRLPGGRATPSGPARRAGPAAAPRPRRPGRRASAGTRRARTSRPPPRPPGRPS